MLLSLTWNIMTVLLKRVHFTFIRNVIHLVHESDFSLGFTHFPFNASFHNSFLQRFESFPNPRLIFSAWLGQKRVTNSERPPATFDKPCTIGARKETPPKGQALYHARRNSRGGKEAERTRRRRTTQPAVVD